MYVRIYFLFSILWIFISAVSACNISITDRVYLISKDFFTGYKGDEFSIYDSTKKHLLYRIESNYAIGQKIKIVNRSTKQIIAMLRNRNGYQASFSIKTSSNQYVNGTIEKVSNMTDIHYIVQWDKHKIFIGRQFKSPVTVFQYEANSSEVLANFERLSDSYNFKKQYKLQILSNELPDTIYFLSVAVITRIMIRGGRG